MKKTVMLFAVSTILLSGIAYGANPCDIWEGTWDVKQDSGDAVWVLPGPATKTPPFVLGQITGTTTANGEENFMQILQVSFYNDTSEYGKFVYSEDEQLGNDMGMHEIFPVENEEGVVCSFTAQGEKYNQYGLISGTKRGEECEVEPEPEPGDNETDNQTECVDQDGDGYGEGCSMGADCNDNDTAVNPGAEEICNDLIDNDCDNRTDCDDLSCEDDPACQVPACAITLSPASVKARKILPKLVVLTITGSGDAFDPAGEVTFDGDGITKLFQSAQGTDTIKVIGILMPGASGSVTAAVAGCDGTAALTIE